MLPSDYPSSGTLLECHKPYFPESSRLHCRAAHPHFTAVRMEAHGEEGFRRNANVDDKRDSILSDS